MQAVVVDSFLCVLLDHHVALGTKGGALVAEELLAGVELLEAHLDELGDDAECDDGKDDGEDGDELRHGSEPFSLVLAASFAACVSS